MAELYIVGQLVGAKEFEIKSLFCKWKLILGSGWKVLEGNQEGQTQVDASCRAGLACWCHPLDVHLVTKGIQGWPRLLIEVWHRDQLERCSLISYGIINIPSEPGYKKLTCTTWKPLGTIVDRLANLFNGETLQLTEECLIFSNEQRFNLQTETMGEVLFELSIILKDFDKFGVETN